MTDIILQHGGNYIKADLDGLKLTLECINRIYLTFCQDFIKRPEGLSSNI